MSGLSFEEANDLLLINKNKLDEACLIQSETFNKIGQKYVGLINIRDKKKNELSTLDSLLASEFRISSEDEGKKITEAKVQEFVQTNNRHIIAMDEYFKIKLEVDEWGILRDSFSQKISMIEQLIKLYLVGYFTDSSVKDTRESDKVIVEKIKKEVMKKRGIRK